MEKMVYDAPQVEFIEVAVEKGFAASGEDELEYSNDPANPNFGIG